ncbi:lipopolysaccharide transport periplasmic protein LptA [Colwellia sp. 75C3]|uniref:lipopolysaccharide transport periplasmic protein LptA n=1 Tax=Colwellia sp. 75C3 TaxID=888425 RepID=UPI001E451366|nr:lipopolysaccharide transport periplasmic protein LptA [Colwellia sp. 75C3]
MMKANLNRITFKRKNFTHNTFKVLALSCCLVFFSSAQAAKKDLEQEITIKSQRQAADLKNKIASYLDNVSIRQGSISITADIVKVFSVIDKKSGEKKDTYLAKGKPAIFQQQLEDGSLIKLQANEITYSPNSNMITITGNALVKQAGSEVSGNEITYNTLSEKLEAKSANNQSVTTVLQPTILKKQKETHEKYKAEKVTDKVVEKEGDSRDN